MSKRLVIKGVASEVSRVLWKAKQLDPELQIVSIENGAPAKVVVLCNFSSALIHSTSDNPHVKCWVEKLPKGPVLRGRSIDWSTYPKSRDDV